MESYIKVKKYIESLGWIYKHKQQLSFPISFQMKEYKLLLWNCDDGSKHINIYKGGEELLHNRFSNDNINWGKVVFDGYIKNKSELIKILQMVNIK